MLRPDAPLIRHLCERVDLATGQAWHRLPYILLPGDGFVEHLVQHTADWPAALPRIDHLDWPDAVFDVVSGRQVLVQHLLRRTPDTLPDRGRCWIRLTDGPVYLREAAVRSPWLRGPHDLLAPFRPEADAWLAIEAWEERTLRPDGTTGFPAYPDVSLIRKDAPWNAATAAHLYPNPGCRQGRAYGDGHGFCSVLRCQYPEGDPRGQVCLASDLICTMGVVLAVATLACLAQTDDYLCACDRCGTPNDRDSEL